MAGDHSQLRALHPSTLAVLTPRWGAPSETFVRRHITEILPGRTVAMTRLVVNENWCPDVPWLAIQPIREFPTDRLARLFGQWRFDRRSRALRKFLQQHQVTAVLGEWLNFSSHWFPNLRDLGLKFFAHAHGYDVTRKALKRPWCKFLYRQLAGMDGVIVVSHLIKQRLLEAFELDPGRVHVIPGGVNVPPAIPARTEAEQVVCVHLGRMVEKKSPLTTLKAFHAAHGECARLRLEFIGNGPLVPECQRYCQDHGLADVVTFQVGKPDDFVKERLRRADIFLLHSVTATNGDEEGLPLAILEGMAHGLPVISTRHSGIPEAVIDGQTGLLVAEHDAGAMARSICELAKQPGLRRQMGTAGYERARELFSAEQEIRRLRELIFGGGVNA